MIYNELEKLDELLSTGTNTVNMLREEFEILVSEELSLDNPKKIAQKYFKDLDLKDLQNAMSRNLHIEIQEKYGIEYKEKYVIQIEAVINDMTRKIEEKIGNIIQTQENEVGNIFGKLVDNREKIIELDAENGTDNIQISKLNDEATKRLDQIDKLRKENFLIGYDIDTASNLDLLHISENEEKIKLLELQVKNISNRTEKLKRDENYDAVKEYYSLVEKYERLISICKENLSVYSKFCNLDKERILRDIKRNEKLVEQLNNTMPSSDEEKQRIEKIIRNKQNWIEARNKEQQGIYDMSNYCAEYIDYFNRSLEELKYEIDLSFIYEFQDEEIINDDNYQDEIVLNEESNESLDEELEDDRKKDRQEEIDVDNFNNYQDEIVINEENNESLEEVIKKDSDNKQEELKNESIKGNSRKKLIKPKEEKTSKNNNASMIKFNRSLSSKQAILTYIGMSPEDRKRAIETSGYTQLVNAMNDDDLKLSSLEKKQLRETIIQDKNIFLDEIIESGITDEEIKALLSEFSGEVNIDTEKLFNNVYGENIKLPIVEDIKKIPKKDLANLTTIMGNFYKNVTSSDSFDKDIIDMFAKTVGNVVKMSELLEASKKATSPFKVLNKFKKDSIELYRLNVIIQDGEHKIDERAQNRKMFNELQQYIESEKNISLNYLDERQGIQYSRKRESREEI